MKIALTPPRRMIIAELFSDLASQTVHLTLLAELFFGLSGSTLDLLLLCLIQQAPAIFLGPLAGRLVNSIGPRMGLVGANLARLSLVAILLVAGQRWAVWTVYLIFSGASLMFLISRLCITPRIVGPQKLIAYNAVNERVALGAGIAGPFLIGLLIREAGAGTALASGLVLYGCSAGLAVGLPNVKIAVEETCEPRSVGLRRWNRAYLAPLTDARVRTWSILMLVTGAVGGVLNYGAPVFNRTLLQGDMAAWGAVMSGYQAGACLATFILPALDGVVADRTLLIACFASVGSGFLLLVLYPGLVLFAFVMAGFGTLFTLLAIFVESRIQRDCAETDRVQILSGLTALGGGCLLAGICVSALAVQTGGVRLFPVLGALLSVVATVVAKRIHVFESVE